MGFVENNLNSPTHHNPYLHDIILREMKTLPKGRVLDVPSGPGYLARELNNCGFDAVAGEIDTKLHCLENVDYAEVDMSGRFPFPDASFDYVASIEGIEHIENRFSFLREARRVLKPGGKLLLTTPNIHSVESRLHFFLSGFHSMAPHPLPLDTENIYFEHINPVSLDQLYYACGHSGFNISRLLTYRHRKGSILFYYLFYPLIHWTLWYDCFRREKNPSHQRANQEIYSFLKSKDNLLGTHTIIIADAI